MVRNCFSDNVIGVAPVAIQGGAASEFIVNSNFNSNSAGGRCNLAAKFVTGSSYENFTPTCTDFDASECQIVDTEAPSTTPSLPPTGIETFLPTLDSPTQNSLPPVTTNSAQSFAVQQFNLPPITAFVLLTILLH